MGVDDDRKRQADTINRFHADIERLVEESGLEWTLLRSGWIVPSASINTGRGANWAGSVYPVSRRCGVYIYTIDGSVGQGVGTRNKDGGRKCYSKTRTA